MKKLILLLFLLGCNQPNLLQGPKEVECEAHYAEDYAREYFGEFNSFYSISIAPLDKILPYCGGSACLVLHHIYMAYPDTHEYNCQKILHELGHLIKGEKTDDMDYEHKDAIFFGSAEQNIRGYISYACEAMRTESLCGPDGELL